MESVTFIPCTYVAILSGGGLEIFISLEFGIPIGLELGIPSNRSEGFARTGYFIPGCDGKGGLEV